MPGCASFSRASRLLRAKKKPERVHAPRFRLSKKPVQTVEKACGQAPFQSSAAACTSRSVFSGAQAQEKQFLPSGNRPENPEIFRFPQSFSPSMKIHRFSWSVSKSFFDTQKPERVHAPRFKFCLRSSRSVRRDRALRKTAFRIPPFPRYTWPGFRSKPDPASWCRDRAP